MKPAESANGQCPFHKEPNDQEASVAHLPLPPGKRGLPLIGETLKYLKSPFNFHKEKTEAYGEIFWSNVFFRNTVFFNTAEATKWVFNNEYRCLGPFTLPAGRELLTDNVTITMGGEAHRKRRKIFAPFMERKKVRHHITIMNEVIDEVMASWHPSKKVSVIPEMRKIAFGVVLKVIMHDHQFDIDELSRLFATYTKGLATPLVLDLPFTPYGKAKKAKKALKALMREQAEKRLASKEYGEDILGYMLTAVVDDSNDLTLEGVLDELVFFLLAGHETSVTAASNLLLALVRHPRVEQKCYQEAVTHTTKTKEGVDAMVYIEQCVKEGMRHITPVGTLFRTAHKDMVYQGYKIPKGWTVAMGMDIVHQSDTYYSKPDTFNPDRFNPPTPEGKDHPMSYLAFGGGVHTCLGIHFAMQEMVMIVAKILQKYKMELVENQDLTYRHMPFPVPKNGILLWLKERKNEPVPA